MSKLKVSIEEIIEFLDAHPHIQELHFTSDGHFHINAYKGSDGNMYSVISDIFPLDVKNKIVETVGREAILYDEDEQIPEKTAAELDEEANERLRIEAEEAERVAAEAQAELDRLETERLAAQAELDRLETERLAAEAEAEAQKNAEAEKEKQPE